MTDNHVKIIGDIQSKYQESFDFLEPRKQRQVNQLVLLNNLQRGDQNISSTLLLTLFTRILSNLYDDKMQIKFVPAEETEQKMINSLNLLAQNDYQEMDKARLDYDWCWDTLFFGRGYMETLRFDKKRKIMKPEVINPLTLGYDPFFSEVKDWRYYWKWIGKNKSQVIKLIKDGFIDGVKDISEIPSGMDEYLWAYKVKRDNAKKANATPTTTYSNDAYQFLEFYGIEDDGEKYVYWLDRDLSKILMREKLDLRDGDNNTSDWPVTVKECFREPHSSVNFSVADLLDDKHRAKSVLLNLAYIAAKDKANPLYVYNPDKVTDVSAFFTRQVNQHISVSDTQGGAVSPLNTQEPLSPGLVQFISLLTQEANDPIGTGMSGNPQKKGKTTATDSAIQQQLNDLAQSLQSKIMQFGEQDFWSTWYHRYKRYTKAGDEKIATIVGVKGMTFEKIDLGDIRTKYPPRVLVFSAKEADYKELTLRRDLMQMYPQFQQTLDPDGMRNFNKYVFFPKFLSDPTTVDILIPKTIDELKAEQENDSIDKEKMPKVLPTDNHEQHILIHHMAKNTWAKWFHIHWHEELYGLQLQQKMQAEQQQQQGKGDMPSGAPSSDKGGKPKDGTDAKKPKVGVKKKDPQENASPLKNEIQPKGNKP